MKTTLKKEYRDLEMKVMSALRDAIENSDLKSKFMQTKAIPVHSLEYVEMAIVNGRLTFLDSNGLHYSVFTSDCSLEDLIDILESIKL